MLDTKEVISCDFCRKGEVLVREQEVAFRQETYLGTVVCKVVVPIGACERCGARSWGPAANETIEREVRRQLSKLR
jgi:hypothetical protein